MDSETRDQGLLTTAELASRPDFAIGQVIVSPSTRSITGPGGRADIEPRVMQVLVVLADAKGAVVTRNTLFQRCWGAPLVGDDSLNRAIAGVRRVAQGVAAGSFRIETVPRTGYRLSEAVDDRTDPRVQGGGRGTIVSRRTVIAGTTAVAAVGGAGWWALDRRRDQEFAALIKRGQDALDGADPRDDHAQYFRQAVEIRPDDAAAQGMLAHALALKAEYPSSTAVSEAVARAERAARAALALDPEEPNARVAISMLERGTLDFATTEDRFRSVLASAPDNVNAMRQYWNLLQCVGRSREGLALVERALKVAPLAASNHFPHAQFLWIIGRNAEADRVIDRAIQYWPQHRWVRFARFTILAFTGRPGLALTMLDNAQIRPQNFSPEATALWRTSLVALDRRTPDTVAAALRANVAAAKRNPQLTSQAVMTLSALGELDAAFEAANALFVVGRTREAQAGDAARPRRSTAWRFAPWLFIPPLAPLRADPRFSVLCDEVGLTDYWAKRNVRPDYQLGS